MTNSSLQKLAEMTTVLLKKTKSREIIWETTSIEDTYATSLGNYTIHIYEHPGSAGQTDIYIQIYNNSGHPIDQFSDVTLSGLGIDTPGYDGFFSIMSELFLLAARQASGADEAVDEILKLLK